LASADTVVVPDPPANLADPDTQIDAVIAALPPNGWTAEKINVTSVDMVSLRSPSGDPGEAVIAYLTLARPSTAVALEGEMTGDVDRPGTARGEKPEPLAPSEDLWTALVRKGVVDSDYRVRISEMADDLLRQPPTDGGTPVQSLARPRHGRFVRLRVCIPGTKICFERGR
jgi:hypothetical protein